jgi:hypothetical protein
MSLVWSLTPYFQERQVLRWRLAELKGVVDRFVFVGANVDHMGNLHTPKWPSMRQTEQIQFRKINLDANTPWGREKQQRLRMAEGLEIADDDVVLLSDLDEIPSAEALTIAAQNATEKPELLRLAMHVYQPKYRWMDLDDSYQICRVFRGSLLKRLDLQQIRELAGTDVHATGVFPGHGWHMAYMGGGAMIKAKLKAFAHEELLSHRDRAKIAYDTGQDLFGRDTPIEVLEPENLPQWARL